VKNKFPLPRISDCLNALSGGVYFVSFDQAYFFQVPLPTKDDKNKTARRGQFCFKVLPMGPSNSPSVFACLMALVLHGLTYLCCLAFIDDCIVTSRSFEDHVRHVELVLQRFHQANLKLKPGKCQLFQSNLKFLGHIVSSGGVEVNPDKVATILAWPFAQNITELRGFIDICNYYRSFCPSFSTIIEPLTEMLRKDVPIEPTEERLAAFNALKAMLSFPPALAMSTDDEAWVVDVDCSAFGVGAVAQQWQNGKLKVIEYASKTLNRAERFYCATRRKLLAMIFALKHFRFYLLGNYFVCRVDHMVLKYNQVTPEPLGQQARFLDFLAEFDSELQFRPGRKHTNCDSLSRVRPCKVDGGTPVNSVIGK